MAVERITALPALPPRPQDGHKGTFGTVLVLAGSRGMSGAAVLCGSAALRGGAGLVRLAVPASIGSIVAAGSPCYTLAYLPDDAAGRVSLRARDKILALAEQASVVVAGPGLGQGGGVGIIVRTLLRTPHPLVLDADALNTLGVNPLELTGRRSPTILTPHPGEFGRLTGLTAGEINADREGHATRFAARHGVIVALKGAGTVVSDGQRLFVNTTGNPGMATGGSGDVLAGLIGALLAQGLGGFAAAQLGVHVHGLAGDLVREERGEMGLIASDLLKKVPLALVKVQQTGELHRMG